MEYVDSDAVDYGEVRWKDSIHVVSGGRKIFVACQASGGIAIGSGKMTIPAKIYIYIAPTTAQPWDLEMHGEMHGEKKFAQKSCFPPIPYRSLIIRGIGIHSTEGRDESRDRDDRLMEI